MRTKPFSELLGMTSFITLIINLFIALPSAGFALLSARHLLQHLAPIQTTLEDLHSESIWMDLLVNFCLLIGFMLIHSSLARWKHWTLSRSVYLVCSAISIETMIIFWRPVPHIQIWHLKHPFANQICHYAYYFGIISVILSVLFSHPLELFGVSQIWNAYKGLPSPMDQKPPGLQRLYNHSRHPTLFGMLLVLWFTPIMNSDRLILAISLTIYQLLANQVDKQDLDHTSQTLQTSYKTLHEMKPIWG